jgi:DNA-binding NarL/FixJ family response regulator
MIAQFAARRPRPPRDGALLAGLTDREREVLLLVAQGRSNREVGEELFISDHTVKTHVGRLLTKLDQRDRVQLVIFAYDNGLVSPAP